MGPSWHPLLVGMLRADPPAAQALVWPLPRLVLGSGRPAGLPTGQGLVWWPPPWALVGEFRASPPAALALVWPVLLQAQV